MKNYIEHVAKEAKNQIAFEAQTQPGGWVAHINDVNEVVDAMTKRIIDCIEGASKDEFLQAHPWFAAGRGEVWALTDENGIEKPYIRGQDGWRSAARRNKIYESVRFVSGRLLWIDFRK